MTQKQIKISTEKLIDDLQNNQDLQKCFNAKFKIDIDNKKVNSKTLEKYNTYYTETINYQKKVFKDSLKNFSYHPDAHHKAQLYTYILQTMGNNLRSSGDIYNNTYNEKSFYSIAERIDSIISIIKNYNTSKHQNTRICIDAFRNPYEAYYFKDSYKCFYLISVSTDDKDRRLRLNSFSAEELDAMDKMEYPTNQEKAQAFFQQSISDCIQISDIHLYNPNDNNRNELLKINLLKYVALMLHPGLITPTHIERCMQTAYNAKFNSGCLSRQVGAIITDEKYYIKAVGWNDVPEGQIPCNLRSIKNYLTDYDLTTFSAFEFENNAFRNTLQELNKKYEELAEKKNEIINTPYCFKDIYNSIKNEKNQVYTRALHAEENAFLQITKFGGQGIKGGKLFVTSSPCELCSKKAFQLGIKEIYYIDPYPGIAHSQIIQAGTPDSRPKSQLFYGAIGNAYVSLYMQRFGVKDELQYVTGIDMKKSNS